MVRLGHIGEIDELFTDRNPPAALTDLLIQGDVRLHVVGDDQDAEI
jgi:DeoR family glycerol-3-phosphate regulon repressor